MLAAAYASVIVHECAHAAVSAALGCPPEEIELSPLGAVMRLEDEMRLSPAKRAAVLAAGPAASFTLCAAAYAMTSHGWLGPDPGRLLFLSNLAILLINLLPLLPMDGGRLMAMLLGLFVNSASVNSCMRWLGRIGGCMLTSAGVWHTWKTGVCNFSLIMLGCYVLYTSAVATTTRAMAELRGYLDRRICLERNEHMKCRWITALPGCRSREIIKAFPARRVCMIRVLEYGTFRTIGEIGEYELMEAYLRNPSCTVGEALMNT